MKNKLFLLLITYLLLTTTAYAAKTDCPEHFANGEAPDIINQKLTVKAMEVCYSGYGLMHSGISRTPIYSAEHLTRKRLQKAKTLKRTDKFHADDNIPESERAELRHYLKSGYDRGHVAPNGDMFDKQSQQESFSLANMVPQVSSMNRGIWEGIESTVREMAKNRRELYVVTGPLYQGGTLKKIGGAVMVPTQMFKAVYDPNTKEAGAFLVENSKGAQLRKLTVSELENLAGINIFPTLDENTKSRLMQLPVPKVRSRAGGR